MLPVKRVIVSAIFSWRLAASASVLRLSRSAWIFRSSAELRLPGSGGATVGPSKRARASALSSEMPMFRSFAPGA
jgi:hypothetical protein